MGILNSIIPPVWLVGSMILLLLGQGRFVLRLMVFVTGAHFVPLAPLLGRRIDYLLGPLTMAFAAIGFVVGLDDGVHWLRVFSIAGIGGAMATGCYAVYTAGSYRNVAESTA